MSLVSLGNDRSPAVIESSLIGMIRVFEQDEELGTSNRVVVTVCAGKEREHVTIKCHSFNEAVSLWRDIRVKIKNAEQEGRLSADNLNRPSMERTQCSNARVNAGRKVEYLNRKATFIDMGMGYEPCEGDIGHFSTAIIELLDDGQVLSVPVDQIRFLD